VVCLLTSASIASAQPRPATVSGAVTSVDGARLPRASLTLTDRRSGHRIRAMSDDLGTYVLDRVPPGTYSLLVEFPGLAPRTVSPVRVGAGASVRVDVALEPVHVHEVTVVSAAVPRDSMEVTDVRESAARDVGELLSEHAGFWKLRKGGIANDIVLRGLQSRDLTVLIDGDRQYGACPNRMDPPAFHVDFSQVERVDVGKGPFDVRYQGSLGGVVNVVTRRPDQGWAVQTSLAAGSSGYVNPSATVSHGGPRLSVLGGLSYRRSDPYRDGRGHLMTAAAGYRADTVDSAAFRAATSWGLAAWRPSAGHQLSARYTRQRTDHVLYPYLLMDAIWDNADRLSVDYQAPGLGPHVQGVKAQVYWSAVDHWMTNAYRSSSTAAPRPYSMGTDATTFAVGGRVDANLGTTSVGVEAYRRHWNAETVMAGMGSYAPQYSIPDVNTDSAGVFVEHGRVLGTRASLDVGGRIDRIATFADPAKANVALYTAYHGASGTSRTDVLPSGSARLIVQLASGIDLTAALGHTARVAEANERFFALRRMGTDWVGNPALAPARNSGVDLSLSFQRPRLTLTASGYLDAVHDEIVVYSAVRQTMAPGVMNAAARSYANADARMRGFEATGSVSVLAPLSISGDLSYVRGTMTPRPEDGITSTDLAEMPPLRARLRARLDTGRVFAEIEGVASASQTHLDRMLGEAATPSYAIANLTAGLRRGRLSATVGVANLFDAYYVEHLSYQRDPYRSGVRVAEPGRNVFTSLLWKF
jgi:iron complex outermembrane receptor protein